MKVVNIEYCCFPCPREDDWISLCLEGRHVKMYPMTFTIQECLEDWCETVGWRYICYNGGLSKREREYYMFSVEMSKYENLINTIRQYARAVIINDN